MNVSFGLCATFVCASSVLTILIHFDWFMRSVLETMDQSDSNPNARPPTIIHSNNETSLRASYKIAISYGAPRFKLCISKMPLHIFNACMYANSQNQQPLSIRTPFVDNGNNIPYSPQKTDVALPQWTYQLLQFDFRSKHFHIQIDD